MSFKNNSQRNDGEIHFLLPYFNETSSLYFIEIKRNIEAAKHVVLLLIMYVNKLTIIYINNHYFLLQSTKAVRARTLRVLDGK